jgi:hypothetical protein
MRLLCSCLALTLVAGLLSAGAPKAKWRLYAPKGAGAKVQFPGEAKEEKTKHGNNLVLTAMGDKAAYLMSYKAFGSDLDLTDKVLVKKILDNARAASARKLGGKLLDEKDIKLGKAVGRSFDLSVPDLGVYRSRVYLTPKRVYQITVTGPKELVEGADATKFLGSLQLTE